MPGRTPQKGSKRSRNGSRPDWVTLPADGYDGPVPVWPLQHEPSTVELELWNEVWRKPQAAAWANDGYERVVARYVAVTVLAEDPVSPSAALLSEVRQLEDRLGLSPMAMKRLQWEVGEPRAVELAEVTDIDRYANL